MTSGTTYFITIEGDYAFTGTDYVQWPIAFSDPFGVGRTSNFNGSWQAPTASQCFRFTVYENLPVATTWQTTLTTQPTTVYFNGTLGTLVGSIITSGYTAYSSESAVLVQDTGTYYDVGHLRAASSNTGLGQGVSFSTSGTVSKVVYFLQKVGLPTGNIWATVRASTGGTAGAKWRRQTRFPQCSVETPANVPMCWYRAAL